VFAELDKPLAAAPGRSLVLLADREARMPAGGPDQPCSAETAPGTLLPFRICQRWLRAAADGRDTDPLMIVAVTALGGDFGFQSAPFHFAGGAPCGVVKGL